GTPPSAPPFRLRHPRPRPSPPRVTPSLQPAPDRHRRTSQVVCPLAVGGDVEPLALLFLLDPQTDQALHDVEGDEGHDRSPREYQAHRLQLNGELLPDAGVAARAPGLHSKPYQVDRVTNTRCTRGRRRV